MLGVFVNEEKCVQTAKDLYFVTLKLSQGSEVFVNEQNSFKRRMTFLFVILKLCQDIFFFVDVLIFLNKYWQVCLIQAHGVVTPLYQV